MTRQRIIGNAPQGLLSFKASSIYRHLSVQTYVLPVLKWIWNTCCQLKHKIFFSLLVHNRLNTRAMLRRKNFFIENYCCVMCGMQTLETREHLFFHCPFARLCWTYLCPSWSPTYSGIAEVNQLKQFLKVPFNLEIIILASWAIWLTRNDYIFDPPSVYKCRQRFKEENLWLKHRATRKDYASFEDWANNFR